MSPEGATISRGAGIGAGAEEEIVAVVLAGIDGLKPWRDRRQVMFHTTYPSWYQAAGSGGRVEVDGV